MVQTLFVVILFIRVGLFEHARQKFVHMLQFCAIVKGNSPFCIWFNQVTHFGTGIQVIKLIMMKSRGESFCKMNLVEI